MSTGTLFLAALIGWCAAGLLAAALAWKGAGASETAQERKSRRMLAEACWARLTALEARVDDLEEEL